jgi:hypothetical protein
LAIMACLLVENTLHDEAAGGEKAPPGWRARVVRLARAACDCPASVSHPAHSQPPIHRFQPVKFVEGCLPLSIAFWDAVDRRPVEDELIPLQRFFMGRWLVGAAILDDRRQEPALGR